MTQTIKITKIDVDVAWGLVLSAQGGAGYDGMTLKDFKEDWDNQIHKIWSRMSAGSYMAQPVKLVEIPKAGGGKRTLGIPTVSDRVAQTVIKNRLEPILEKIFHDDSYGYRPEKSAHDAVGIARSRSFKYKWVIDLDIKGFFDNIDHDNMVEMLAEVTDDKATLLYSKRFLKAEAINSKGEKFRRDKGTPPRRRLRLCRA